MCGFAGIFNNSFPITKNQLQNIAAQVSFRGPDSCGIRLFNNDFISGDAGTNAVFFNRLAILDLDSRSDQPFEDENFSLTFNGEIYNYTQLKHDLQSHGHSFHTTSDTEVLFHALREWGTEALHRINGMFAFCWVDKRKKSFLIARDRIGIKPLYYSLQQKTFIYGSELDTVLRLSKKLPETDLSAIHMYLWMQFVPTPYTIVKGVSKLPPGHYITGSWGDLQNERLPEPVAFWDAYKEAVSVDTTTSSADLENVLVDSLSRQLVADVPLGLFLSSGVDSSLLAALVNKHFAQSQKFDFFTVAFTETTANDESKDALDYIKGFNNPSLRSHTLIIDQAFIGQQLDDLYNYFDEPFGDQTSLLNWMISKKAKEHVTVALSGDGADELFWGYKRYQQWQKPSLLLFNRVKVDKTVVNLLKPLILNEFFKAKASLELEPDPIHRHYNLFLHPAFRHLQKDPVWNKKIWAMDNLENILKREDLVALLDLKTYLADAMLYKVDRASMAASLEVRVPYLDNNVVDYALKLPFNQKSNEEFQHKAVLKELLQKLAPHYPIKMPKKGFNFPLDKWLRFQWKGKALELITRDSLTTLGLDSNIYMKIVEQYYAGDKRLCIAVWYLLNLVLWHQKYKKIIPLQAS